MRTSGVTVDPFSTTVPSERTKTERLSTATPWSRGMGDDVALAVGDGVAVPVLAVELPDAAGRDEGDRDVAVRDARGRECERAQALDLLRVQRPGHRPGSDHLDLEAGAHARRRSAERSSGARRSEWRP